MQSPSLIQCVTDATKCRYKQLPGERTDNSAGFSRKGEGGCNGMHRVSGRYDFCVNQPKAKQRVKLVGWQSDFYLSSKCHCPLTIKKEKD